MVGPPERLSAGDPGKPARPRYRGLRRAVDTAAVAASVPTLFYGVLGTGSTIIVWALVEFDPLRTDFYLSVFATASTLSYLLRRLRLGGPYRPARGVAVIINAGCIACTLLVAAARPEALAEPVLTAVLALLVLTPVLNVTSMLAEPAPES